ncbi:MAG: DUF697 domain-containing protein [Nitrospirae bacterium]|nr:DUF697 domain-containing protein [Nitrospirota bacterium]
METKEATETKETEAAVTKDKIELSDDTIRHHMWISMGFGLIPVPLVDFLAVTGVQLDMLRKLSAIYEIPFSKEQSRSIIASLLGGIVPAMLGMSLGSLIKAIPLIGQTAGALAMPAVAGGSTYAVGKVFVQHFESGGTFLDFEPEKVREYFAGQFKEGQKIAVDLKKEAAAKKAN